MVLYISWTEFSGKKRESWKRSLKKCSKNRTEKKIENKKGQKKIIKSKCTTENYPIKLN